MIEDSNFLTLIAWTKETSKTERYV